ncbi:MAG: hypothetical protein IH957_04180 [Chloroflexi bacterium]|nr:hypothetical protein [Chloroflexota bacterium]
MTLIKRGTIKSYDSGSHLAAVQMAGSLTVYLDAIPVATDIPAAEVVAERECTVVFFGEAHDPDDAVIAAIHGAPPADPVDTFLELTDTPGSYGGQGGKAVRVNVAESALEFATISGGGGSKIEDADGDTKVDVEESADEDRVRMNVAATERFVLQAASPQLKITGAVLVTEHIAGKGTITVETKRLLDIGGGATYSQQIGLHVGMGSTVLPGTGDVIGVGGYAIAKTAGDIRATGLSFIAGMSTIDLTDAYAIDVQCFSFGSGKTIANAAGVRARPGVHIFSTLTTFRAFHAHMMSAGTNRYGFVCDDIGGGTIARYLELGSLPDFMVKARGEWTPAANETPVWVAEGAAPTSRQVRWKDGASVGSGDKVMILV